MEPVRILVVEDEGVTAMDIQAQLQSLGYDVPVLAFSGEEAVAQTESLRPDLILMDIHLTGKLNGIEAAAQIRERYNIPLIYLTAYADEETLQQAKLTEPVGYILKPFDQRTLRSTIEMALYRHKMERQRADILVMLSHDIRNPLSIISGYADMLTEELHNQDLPEAKELLHRIQRTTASVCSMVTNYLDVSRLEAGQFVFYSRPLQLQTLLSRLVEQYEAEAAHRHLRLSVTVADSLPDVQVDALALERVFANLLDNALKFTPEFGCIAIGAELHEPQHEVAVTISNTGPEIPPEMLPHLFEKYRQASITRTHAGVGLGLFIVKTFVEAQGGRVIVENIPATGVRFCVFLPQAQPSPQH